MECNIDEVCNVSNNIEETIENLEIAIYIWVDKAYYG